MVKYWLDAYQAFWGHSMPAEQDFWKIVEREYPRDSLGYPTHPLDGWLRGAVEFSDETASAMQKFVVEWNVSVPNGIIGFGPATGDEHIVSIQTGGSSNSPKYSDSWQQ